MTTKEHSADLLKDGVVVDSEGTDIGQVAQVYLDNDSGTATWVTVKTGWFGSNESFVPLRSASVDAGTIRVPYDKAMIKDAPHFDADAPLTEDDEQRLYSYYGVEGRRGVGTTGADDSAAGTAPSAASATGAGEYLTRSEEHLHVGTERVQTGRARLRKFVVTEEQTVTVPVSREEVRVVREPLVPGEDADDVTIGEDATDVTLTEERVVVGKETVPVEKVRLGTETVTENREVTQAVRKEQIEFDDGVTPTHGDDGTVPAEPGR
jgi:uncharacterized protein (TIGR02271 family)